MSSMTCLLKRPKYKALYGAGVVVTSESAAGYRSMIRPSRAAAYPETDRAPRDRIRVGPSATTPVAGCGPTAPFVAPTGLHRRAREPGHRVRRGAPAGALLWTVAVHLGHPDRADPDLPDGRLLRRRPVGR